MILKQEVIDKLSPGVRDLVIYLNHCGFETTDSGDGSNYADGMEGAMPVPMVAVKVEASEFFVRAVDLHYILNQWEKDQWDVQANYSPKDGVCVLLATRGVP